MARCDACGFSPCRCEDLAAVYKPLRDGRRVQVAGVTGKAGWPRESDAMGVLPTQIEAAYEESVKAGVPTEFTKDGRPKITSQRHQERYAKAIGMHENNCFNW